MDDLKLYVTNDKHLETLLKFDLEKCSTATLKIGKLAKSINITLDKENEIGEARYTDTQESMN